MSNVVPLPRPTRAADQGPGPYPALRRGGRCLAWLSGGVLASTAAFAALVLGLGLAWEGAFL